MESRDGKGEAPGARHSEEAGEAEAKAGTQEDPGETEEEAGAQEESQTQGKVIEGETSG
jgi:hypothetical protein